MNRPNDWRDLARFCLLWASLLVIAGAVGVLLGKAIVAVLA